jgi:hypothetical protein
VAPAAAVDAAAVAVDAAAVAVAVDAGKQKN